MTAPVDDTMTPTEVAQMLGAVRRSGPLGSLTEREQQILALVATGMTDPEIASELAISVSTVRSHLDRVRVKAGLRRRSELTALAVSRVSDLGARNTHGTGGRSDLGQPLKGFPGREVTQLRLDARAIVDYIESAMAKRRVSQALAEARCEAYSRYLAAQQALHLSIKNEDEIEITRNAVRGRLATGRMLRAPYVYAESSSAEMKARLLAGAEVRAAIDAFERYIASAISAAEGKHDNGGASFADDEWDRNRDGLIDEMRREIYRGFGKDGDT